MREDPTLAQEARHAAEAWRNYFNENINHYHDNYAFVKGRDWVPDDEREVFKTNKKRPLCMNKLNILVKTLSGEQRQNTPNIEVKPQENANLRETKIREALIKHISIESRARSHYKIIFEQMEIGGFSAGLVTTEYENDYSFNQNIVPRSFRDPTKCFFDVHAENRSKTDGGHCGFTNYVDRKKVKEKYGEEVDQKTGNIASENTTFTWSDDDGICIIDFYKKEYDSKKIYQLSNGEVIDEDTFKKAEKDEIEGETVLFINGEFLTVDRERKVPDYTIKYYKIAGDFVLEETIVHSKQLPMVFFDAGSWYDKDFKQICESFIDDAKDPQIYLNYLATQSAYILKNTRYDQFLVSKENVRGRDTKNIWDDPSNQKGALYFDKDKDGFVPKQLNTPELPQSLSVEYQRAMNDIYTSTGMYAARLGDKSNEYSGAAIDARTRQGSYSTYIYYDALNYGIGTIAEIVNEMIPHVYDTERVMQLMLPDEGLKDVVLNKQVDQYGQQIENDMTRGTYTVELAAGPSFEGQKQQALESLQQVLQANPQVFPFIADLYAENLPLANNIQIRNRLRLIVPPNVLQAEETGQPVQQQNQPSPEEMAELQELQLKERELQLKEEELQLKKLKQTQDVQLEIERLEKERLEIAAKLEEKQLSYSAEMHRTLSNEQIARADNITDILTHKIQ